MVFHLFASYRCWISQHWLHSLDYIEWWLFNSFVGFECKRASDLTCRKCGWWTDRPVRAIDQQKLTNKPTHALVYRLYSNIRYKIIFVFRKIYRFPSNAAHTKHTWITVSTVQCRMLTVCPNSQINDMFTIPRIIIRGNCQPVPPAENHSQSFLLCQHILLKPSTIYIYIRISQYLCRVFVNVDVCRFRCVRPPICVSLCVCVCVCVCCPAQHHTMGPICVSIESNLLHNMMKTWKPSL